MKFFYQVFYSIKRVLAEPKPLIIQLVAYSVIILVLGAAFGDAFEVTKLDTVNVLYCNKDEGDLGEEIITNITSSDEIKELIDFKSVSSKEEAEKKIQKGDAAALLYIPEEFTSDEKKGKQLEVFMLDSTSVDATIVKNVVDSFVNAINTKSVVYKYAGSEQANIGESYNSVVESSVDKDIAPDAMTYYAIAMILMMLLSGANYGRIAISDYYLGTLGDRMKLSPVNGVEQYAGTILGYSFVSFVQAVCLMLFSHFAFKTNWGKSIILAVFVMFTFSILTSVFGAMLSSITLDDEKSQRFITVFILVFTFLAGGFTAKDFGIATKFSPSYYARNALFNIIYNGNMSQAWINIAVLWGLIVVFTVISVIALRRKKV